MLGRLGLLLSRPIRTVDWLGTVLAQGAQHLGSSTLSRKATTLPFYRMGLPWPSHLEMLSRSARRPAPVDQRRAIGAPRAEQRWRLSKRSGLRKRAKLNVAGTYAVLISLTARASYEQSSDCCLLSRDTISGRGRRSVNAT
jgi:hypothetical protein